MKKTVGVLAHVDAGKTTFSEQILFHGKSIRKRGRVDHKNAFLDSHSVERDRGITVFSDQATFQYEGSTYYLIDTPGHVDFSSEMERAIGVMDYAIIIISGPEGVQSHTERVWELLNKHKVPIFFFINKMDRIGADIDLVLEEIGSKLTKDICYISEFSLAGDIPEELIEFIAERDEYLLERYIEGEYDRDLWLNSLRELIKENKVFPCFSGSALEDEGVLNFLEAFHHLTYTNYSDKGEFGGYVYKIRHDEENTRITYIKALTGSLRVKDEIYYNEETSEKVNQIRIYNGNKFTSVDQVFAGDLFAVTGLTHAKIGQAIGTFKEDFTYNMVATLKSKVIFDESLNVKDVLSALRILEAEDPALNVVWDENFKQIHIHIMGVIQLEVLKKLMEERFNIEVDFGPCEILYKETIGRETIGYGHFEPLGHYAEVHLKLEPMERNRGIVFKSLCHTDHLSIWNQNLVKSHIFEREHRGILTGSPLTDIKITLLRGKAHYKHTSGGDFREATYRALRQGLEKTENILLEPYYNIRIEVHLDHMGRVLSDIERLKGSFDTPEILDNKVIIRGRGPVATFMDYTMEFTSFTKGMGKINLSFHGYDICHNPEEVIERINYNKDADPEYTSNSIFCSKGKSYVVKGREGEKYMHCL